MIFFAYLTKTGYLKSHSNSLHIYEMLNSSFKKNTTAYFIIVLHPFHNLNKHSIKDRFNTTFLITSPSLTHFNHILKKETSLLTLTLILISLFASNYLFKILEQQIAQLNKKTQTLQLIPLQFKKEQSRVNNTIFKDLLLLKNDYTLYYMHATLNDFILSLLIDNPNQLHTYISDISKRFPNHKCTLYSMNIAQNILTIYGVLDEN